jgi:hypothetical protein
VLLAGHWSEAREKPSVYRRTVSRSPIEIRSLDRRFMRLRESTVVANCRAIFESVSPWRTR